MIRQLQRVAAAMLVGMLAALPAAAATCPVKLGVVIPVTGPLASVVAAMLTSAQLAVDQINAAGGVLGCQAALVVRDSQAQPAVAVDAARQLIDLEHLHVLIGEVNSGDTLAILNSVTVPAKVPLISPTASSPSFTEIGGRTGLFFRTNVSDALMGVAVASRAVSEHAGKVAVLAVNNDWGTNLANIFKTSYERLGGAVTRIVIYDPGQTGYRAEVTTALADKPDTMFLIGYATEGARVARDWISQGGTQHFLFANTLNDASFVKGVGAEYLMHAVWVTPGTSQTPSLDSFRKAYTARTSQSADGPGRAGIYDAVVLTAMAMQAAHTDQDSAAITAGFRRATDPQGITVYAGEDGFRTAFAALAEGKPVNYVGAVGPLQFDGNGDIAVPFVAWTLDAAGALQITDRMSVEQVAATRQQIFPPR